MIRIALLLIAFLVQGLSMETLTPTKSFQAKGDVQDIFYDKNKNILYAANSNGSVELFDVESSLVIKTIELPTIIDFIGDVMPSKIYSIDVIEEKLLIVSQGMKGYRNLWIYENDTLTKIFDIDKKYFLQKASFIDKDRILFALLSNQVGLYNLKTEENEYFMQLSHSSFSHFKVSVDKKSFASTDESGIVRLFNTQDGIIIKTLEALNLDKVYQVDYKNDVILTAGQDRKAVVYPTNAQAYVLHFDFLLYSCALSTNSTYGAVSYNEKNEILVFDIANKRYLYNLIGQKATLTQILFISEKELIASSDSNIINFWKF